MMINAENEASRVCRLGHSDVLLAELDAIEEGLKVCQQLNLHSFILETDSSLAFNMILQPTCEHWKIYVHVTPYSNCNWRLQQDETDIQGTKQSHRRFGKSHSFISTTIRVFSIRRYSFGGAKMYFFRQNQYPEFSFIMYIGVLLADKVFKRGPSSFLVINGNFIWSKKKKNVQKKFILSPSGMAKNHTFLRFFKTTTFSEFPIKTTLF